MGIKNLSKVLAKQTQQHIEMVIYHNCQRLTLQGEEGNHTQVNKHKTLSKHHETEQDSKSWCEIRHSFLRVGHEGVRRQIMEFPLSLSSYRMCTTTHQMLEMVFLIQDS